MADTSEADDSRPGNLRSIKSAEQIQSKLKSLEWREPGGDRGDRNEGMRAEDYLVIASFRDEEVYRGFQQFLGNEGILFRTERSKNTYQVLVEFSDRQKAAELLNIYQQEHPDKTPEYLGKRWDFTIFGLLLGGVMGAVVIAADRISSREVSAILVGSVTGAVGGNIFDGIMMYRRRTGRFRIGLREFLLVATLGPLVMLMFRILKITVN